MHRELLLAVGFEGRYKAGDNCFHKKTQGPDKVKLYSDLLMKAIGFNNIIQILELISAIKSLGLYLISELQFTQVHNGVIFSPPF